MTDIPPNINTAAADDSSGEFDKALALAKVKTAAARAILNTAGLPPDEAAGQLMTGWRQVALALGYIERQRGEDASLALQRALEPGGLVYRKRNVAIADIEELTREHSKYLEGIPTGFGLAEWKRIAKDLEFALRALERWNIRFRAGKKRKIFHIASRGAMALVALAATVAIVIGLVITFHQPDTRDGLSATYYVKPDFTGHFFNRLDSNVNFNWGAAAPLYGVPGDGFSARWQGCIFIENQLPMFLVAGADDGAKVFIDGSLAIDNGKRHKYIEVWAQTALQPGTHSIRMDYVEGRGIARVFLGWSKIRGQAPEAVPYNNLIPLSGNEKHTCRYLTVKEEPHPPKPLQPQPKKPQPTKARQPEPTKPQPTKTQQPEPTKPQPTKTQQPKPQT